MNDKEFYQRWPDACRLCDVTGIVETHPQNWWTLHGDDPCPECNQQHKCPRCMLTFSGQAEEDFFEEIATCPMCGYNHGFNPDDYPRSTR